MKRIWARLALVLFAVLAISCGRFVSPWAAPSTHETLPGRDAFARGLVSSERAVLNDLSGATQYQIDLTVASDVSLQAHQQVLYTNREDVALQDIYFRLLPNGAGGQLSASNVAVDGQAVDPAYTSGNLALRVPLAVPLSPGQQISITLDFALTLPREAGGNYGLLGYLDSTILLDESHPLLPSMTREAGMPRPRPPMRMLPITTPATTGFK